MKHPIRKMIIALAIAAALLIPIYFILSDASFAAAGKEAARRNYDRLDSFNRTMDRYYEDLDKLEIAYLIEQGANFGIEVLSLREYVEDGRYTGPDTFENGFVLKLVNGEAVYPEGWSAETAPVPDNIGTEETTYCIIPIADGKQNVGIYVRLADDIYAVKMFMAEKVEEYLKTYLDAHYTIRAMEEIFKGSLVLFDLKAGLKIDDESGFLPENCTPETSGLDLSGDPWEPRDYIKDGKVWHYIFRDLESRNIRVVFFYTTDEIHGTSSGSALIVLAVLALIAAGLITWHIAVQHMVRDKILTAEQYKRYLPSRVRRMTALVCLACTAAVFLTAFYYMQLTSLRAESTAAAEALQSIGYRIGTNVSRNEALQEWEQKSVLKLVRKAAEQMSEKPNLQTKEYLKHLSSAIGCEYLMIYDADGREILSDQDYTGFTLGSSEKDEMYPFRRLLQGVETWTAEAGTDSITGKTLRKIGVRMAIEGSDRYGALIVAMSPETLLREDLQDDENTILEMITPSEALCFSVNRETGVIDYASAEGMKLAAASTYGISKALLRDNESCGITINGITWYGASQVSGQQVWFYCVSGDVLQVGNLDFALLSAAAALAYAAILAAVLLWKYSQKEYDHFSTIGQEVVHSQTVEVVTADGRIKKTVDPTMRWGTFSYRWHMMDPGSKAKLVFQAALLLVSLIGVGLLYTGGGMENSVLGFIISGHWDRGFNLFALTAVVGMAATALMAVLILKLSTQLICMSLGTKGETILRLLINLAEYIILFTVIYYTFLYFGIDTNGLLGAMGFVALAVSLGARDIVSDILAGITIVFEGEYQVGDIVDIGGYKGKVMEIGARSTKLMGQGDNVKIINNRDVKNVLNMTRFNSWYAMELNIASAYPLEKMEKLLQKELPAIGERMEEIISGPVYKGVEAIGKGSFRVIILAECREDNFRWVQRQLNREIRLLLDREEIPMA